MRGETKRHLGFWYKDSQASRSTMWPCYIEMVLNIELGQESMETVERCDGRQNRGACHGLGSALGEAVNLEDHPCQLETWVPCRQSRMQGTPPRSRATERWAPFYFVPSRVTRLTCVPAG